MSPFTPGAAANTNDCNRWLKDVKMPDGPTSGIKGPKIQGAKSNAKKFKTLKLWQ
jgi:hypothetical protein